LVFAAMLPLKRQEMGFISTAIGVAKLVRFEVTTDELAGGRDP
jgi:hypothetical protein